ncbi:MAG: PRC-barrel domain-containing protein [archaeon]|jgi:sporulation protein YlmC with PRC-barrel domain|nr:PRC-barrel domain-containing protein [archaeon]MDA1167636.1 PRC-barrel domain-containing protein [archaeon]
MAIFGREIIGRQVFDQTGQELGILVDLHFDLFSGLITEFIVKVNDDIDAQKLPFECDYNIVKIPTEQVNSVAKEIRLSV